MPSGLRHDLAALVPPSARRVLEVGCRTGETGAAIKARLPGCWVAGIEAHPAQAAEARRRLDEVVTAMGGPLPLPPGSFDAVVVPDALGHLPDPRPLIRGLRALVTGDGLLIVAAPAARNVAAISRALGSPEAADAPSRRYTRAELLALVAGADFSPTSLRTLPDPGMPTNPPPLDGGRITLDLGRLILRALSAEEVEAVCAAEFVVTGVPTNHVPDCSIIIVDEDADRARECVKTVRRHPPTATRELIVVLVGVAGGDAPEVARGVRLLANRDRLGYAAARNQGARHARGETLVFLDGSARPEPGWLDALLDTARRHPGAVVGSKRLYPDGTVAHAGVAFGGCDLPWRILPYPLYRNAAAAAPYVDRERRLSAVAGSGLLVPRGVFLDVGGFDERFETPHADVALCLSVRSRALGVRYCPASVIREPRNRPGGGAAEEALVLFDKWGERLGSDDDALCRADGTDLDDLYGTRRPAPPPASAPAPAPVVWTGHFTERAGYSEEARSFVVALARLGVDVQANSWLGGRLQVTLPEPMGRELARLFRPTTPERFVHVMHMGLAEPSRRRWRHPRAVRHVLRTMFETDRIPAAWVGPCLEMDELWVPTTFNVEAFAASGVPREKLCLVPGALPTDPFDPTLPPLPLRGASGFVFLSVFGWGARKGWEVTLQAYLEEFRRDDPVSLVFHVQPFYLRTVAHHLLEIRALMDDLGRRPEDGPPVLVRSDTLSVTDMTRLYRAADAFVLATRGEGFGRPFLEAMAVGVPTIGTGWGGQLDFMRDDNAYLVDYTVGPLSERLCQEYSDILGAPRTNFRDLRCAEPSLAHLRTLMRRVYEERGEAAAKAARAQAEVLDRFSWPRVAAVVAERLGVTPRRSPRARPEPPAVPVTWEGPQFVHFGMAVVNRELCRALLAAGDVDLTLAADPPAGATAPGDPRLEARLRTAASAAPAVHVRHEWPPRFDPPPGGRWVMIQPWEFGALPRDWIEPMNRLVDEVWVPSQYVRTCYVRSGVDPRRVVVVPNGVDPARFHPQAPPRTLPTTKRFRLLFVGGTLLRKGADILLDTYLRTFRRDDDVSLVVKDLGADTFYRGQGLRDQIRALQSDPRCPEIVYLEDDLTEDELPGLYTACHCLVHPYRGEGFGLPILEAMACGLAVVVPGYGPALELCDPESAYVVPACEVRLAEPRIGDLQTVDLPWLAEVDRMALAMTMRRVVQDPSDAAERGRRASARARTQFTWAAAARTAGRRLRALADTPIRRSAATAEPAPPRRLSVCMIVRDEAARLPACLESLRGVADQLVVVDTGSIDRTIEVARAHGAQVFEAPWTDDWAAARNVSLAHATGDWILVIDADQALEPTSRSELRRLIQHDAPVGFLVRQLNYTDGSGPGAVVEHLTVRLFPNHPAIRYTGRIHEQVTLLDPSLTLGSIPCGVILHHQGYGSPEARRRKAERDLPILERLAAECPTDAFHAYNLGVTYHLLARLEDAESALRRAVAIGGRRAEPPGGEPPYLVTARVALALGLMLQHREAEAATWCREAVARAPHLADAWCTLGAAELRLGRLEAAEEAYRRALGCTGPPSGGMTDRAASGWKAWCGMGRAQLLLGRWREALASLERALALSPAAPEVLEAVDAALAEGFRHHADDDPRLHRVRGRLLAERGDHDRALASLGRALELDDGDPATLFATGAVLSAVGAEREAEAAYRAARALMGRG